MTIPVSLNTISNLQDTTTAQTNINANSAAITGGFSTALNVTGDQMKGNLDMNSNQILNLPSPATANSPARLVDITGTTSIASVPPVGTSGAVVPLLNAANIWSNTQSFGALTATTITASTVNASTLNVTSSAVFSGSVSLPLSAARARVNSLNLYVNASTGSDSNTGGTATTAFSTIGACVTYFNNNFDVQGVNINVAAGTYNEQVQVTTLNRGIPTDIVFVGAGSATTTIQAPNTLDCFFIKDYGVADISGFTLKGSASAVAGISCGQFGVCDLTTDVVFGSFPLVGAVHIISQQNASVNILNNYTISGAATYHMFVTTGGLLAVNPVTVTIPTTLTFNTFGYFNQGAAVNIPNYSLTGAGATTCVGTRFFIGTNAVVASNGTDLNKVFPGNASGVYYVSSGFDSISTGNTVTSLANISAVKGYLAVVSDATVTTPNTTVTGGGANTVLTWYTGASWKIIGY